MLAGISASQGPFLLDRFHIHRRLLKSQIQWGDALNRKSGFALSGKLRLGSDLALLNQSQAHTLVGL